MIATGSRGDVQPQAALAQGLQAAGWRVRFATHRCFQPLVEAAGLDYYKLSGDSQGFFSGAAGMALREKLEQRNGGEWCQRFLGPFIRKFLAECTSACADADAILYWPPTQVGPSLTEKLGVPSVGVATFPLPHCRTRAFANPFYQPLSPRVSAAARRLGLEGAANAVTWRFGEAIWADAVRTEINRWRVESLGLAPLTPRRSRRLVERTPHLLGFSPAVLTPPRDWSSQVHVSGYWFLDLAPGWTPPREIADFLASGPPPVIVGFGSMASRDAAATTAIVLEALERTGLRAIVVSGWGGLKQAAVPDSVRIASEMPHDWLFPRAAAVVHHGGSGTTAAALRAGIPNVIVPFGFDQCLWGRRIAELQLGPPPIPHAELTAERLAAALRQATADDRMRDAARRFQQVLQQEDGIGRAVAVIDRCVPR
jgi:UDP:flavonoid glycosyltransferase YjiC (YdhE family)